MPTFNPDGDYQNPWKLDEGLPTDFEATVKDVEFFFDPKYGNGAVLLAVMTLGRLDGEADVETRYAMGPGWTPVGNQRAIHDNGKNVMKNTQYGQFIARVLELVPESVLRGRDPRTADGFKDLTFYWERETKSYEFQKDGQTIKGESSRLFPTKFLGVGGSQATLDFTETSEPTETVSAGGIEVVLPARLAAEVKALAKTLTYNDWGNKVLQLDGAIGFDALIKAVSQEAFYNGLR